MATLTSRADTSTTLGYAMYGSTAWNTGTTDGACQGAYKGTTASKSRVGVMVFREAATLKGKVIKKISLKLVCSGAGSASSSKILSFRQANYQFLKTGIRGADQVGTPLGILKGKFYKNTTTHVLSDTQNAEFFHAIRNYFSAGNCTLVLYNGETSPSDSYSANYARVTTCLLTVEYGDAAIWYRHNGAWISCTVWVRVGGTWVPCAPYYFASGSWKRV